jgi:hypothetical protein
LLPKLYYCHGGLVKKPNLKNQPKRPNQNGKVQIDLSKITPLSSWTWGQKTHMGGFLIEIFDKKTVISYNERLLIKNNLNTHKPIFKG